MSLSLSRHPERLLATVVGMDDHLESRLRCSVFPAMPDDRLGIVLELLTMARSREPLVGPYGDPYDSPEMLWHEAECVNLEHRQRFGEDSYGWEEWLYWWHRFEQALTARVLGIITGLEGTLESSFLLRDQIRRSSIPSDSQGPGSRNRWEGCGNP